MANAWIGPAKYLFIPLVVQGTPGYDPPPADYREFVQRRVYFDPDPETNEDRSLMSYFSSVSYDRAVLDATVAPPVTLTNLQPGMSPTLPAINAQPDAHEYEYIAVVYPPNRIGAGGGQAAPGQIQFTPPRSPNRTKARCRFRHDAPIGTWAMEVIHNVTSIGDFYNGAEALPGDFEEMDNSGATHSCSYTKLEAGWLDLGEVPTHRGTESYTLHAIGLPHPAPSSRVAAVKLQATGSNRYLLVEARLRSDRWDRGFSAANGIPSEGVVVYEFAPQEDSWPRNPGDPTGPWPPLQLRTPTALTVGETFTHHDGHTTKDGPADHRSGFGRNRQVRVRSDVPGGFVVDVTIDDEPPDPSLLTWRVSWGGVSQWEEINRSSHGLGELAFGDFNGDGKTDVFRADGGVWRVSWGGTSRWDQINTSSVGLGQLAFGDFNGDGKTDVFRADGGVWRVSWGGTSRWDQINTSSVGLGQLAFGDFNGDGKTDVFRADGGVWRVSWGGTSRWDQINTSSVGLGQLAFGDFNGDGKTDVFRADGGVWRVSWGGTSRWDQINTSSVGLGQLAFGDFNGDGKTDVFRADGGVWRVSWGGTSRWDQINTSSLGLDQLAFGDFDGDGKTDVFRNGRH